MKLKRIIPILLSLVLLLVLAACGQNSAPAATEAPAAQPTKAEVAAQPTEPPAAPTEAPAQPTEPPAPAAEPVTIQVYYPVAVDAPIANILQGYADKFHEQNPNITVEPVFSGGYGDVQTAIQTIIDGGGEPPALAVMLATSLYDLVNADAIAPLDDYINAMDNGKAYMDDFVPAFMENSKYDGKTWSIPFQRSAVVMYYNKDMFKEAGLEAPTSWQTWAEAGQKLTVKNGDTTNWGIQYPSGWPYWLFQPLAIGNGQNIFTDDCHVAFNDPKVVEAVQFYIDLSHKYEAMPKGVQSVWPSAPTDFASGATAMIVHSSGSLNGILKQASFDVGVMPLPGKADGTYASVPGGGNFYILKGAAPEKQDAAWKFIEFVTQPEYVADYSINTGYIPNRTSAFDTDAMKAYLEKTPQMMDAFKALQHAGAEFSIQDLGEVRNIFHDYLQKAYNDEMSAQDAMDAAQKDAEAALKPFCE